MAKKNKPLNVGGFMQEVKNNQPTKNEEFPEKNKEVTVPESTQSSVVDDGRAQARSGCTARRRDVGSGNQTRKQESIS